MADAEVVVAAVALVISVVAFLATFMQVLQQYYASAAGYSQCNEKVMGKWALTKSRRFSWEELRFEVQFDAPVIFVSPPSNKAGPVPGAPIHFLDGSEKSLEETWSDSNMDQRKAYESKTLKEKIHTADNERASWSILLSAIQRMESDSRNWQNQRYEEMGPPDAWSAQNGLPPTPPTLHESHTLTVALQKKRKSWDTMPSSVARPYATTTMCHLVEMMAALGVYWKEFDRKHDRYRAEGNGFMVLGERITDLGLMFSFQVYGKCTFGKNRVIPVDEVKELCFGYVPTIYRETLDQRRLEFPNDEPNNLSSLQMASRSEIAETLILIGVNNNTVRYFTDPGKRTAHLFPVSFEILGMLSRTFYIKNSMFTYIPNPTPDRWDKRSLSLKKILEAYKGLVEEEILGISRNASIIRKIQYHVSNILSRKDTTSLDRLCLLRALYEAIDDCDEILTAKGLSSRHREDEDGRPSVQARDISAEKVPKKSPETARQTRRREVVQDVLRSHIQEVLGLLNDRDDLRWDTMSLRTERAPSPTSQRFPSRPRPPQPNFDDMNDASPDDRQQTFMEVYFGLVRPKVVRHSSSSTAVRRASLIGGASLVGAPPGFGFRRAGTGRTHASSVRDDGESLSPVSAHVAENSSSPVSSTHPAISPFANQNATDLPPTKEIEPPPIGDIHLADEEVSHDDVWCTLVFRMICWLMLHDFNKLDVQVGKSELLGSRMPVYIA